MLETLLGRLLGPLVSLWLANSPRSWRLLPTPEGRSVTFAAGPNADRVLLVGAGIAVGYGVRVPDLALGGHLARGLGEITGRGASIDIVAGRHLRASDCAAVLAEFDLDRFDAVVMTVGTEEALHFASPPTFRAQLGDLVAWVEKTAPANLGVLMVGIPDITAIMRVPAVWERQIAAQCRRLDEALRSVCRDNPRITYVPFVPARADLERDGDRHFYAAWAALISPAVARVLDARVVDPRDPATIEELRRQRALDALCILDTAAEPRFDKLVVSARDLFGVQGASITFIDRDRQWSKAAVGIDPVDSPRGGALGDATVHNGKLLVVEDASLEDRFSGHPWVVGSSAVRFFAGFPIESAQGERIGAFCLSDGRPRTFTAAEDALLGSLAQQVQVELWGAARA